MHIQPYQGTRLIIALSTEHVSAIFPFKGKFNTTSLIVSLHLCIVLCYTVQYIFSNISQHTQHVLGQARPVIGLNALPSTQVR